MGRYPHAYISMSVQLITHATDTIFSSQLGWYGPLKTMIRVTLLSVTEIHVTYVSPSILYNINVSNQFLHMSSRHCGGLLYGKIVPDDPLVPQIIT